MKLKGEKDKSRTIVEYISTFLFAVARTSRQEVSKDIGDLKNTTNQLHLADISRAFYPIIAEYTFFFYKRTWNIPQNRPCSARKILKSEISQSMFRTTKQN